VPMRFCVPLRVLRLLKSKSCQLPSSGASLSAMVLSLLMAFALVPAFAGNAAAQNWVTYLSAQAKIGSGWSCPTGVVTDAAGNVYVADSCNSSVTKVAPDQTSSAVGSGWSSPVAVAFDGNSGALYVADNGLPAVVKIASDGTQTTVDTGAFSISSPQGVAVDAQSDLYILDSETGVVLKITSGGQVSPVSLGSYTLSSPQGICVDAQGNIYIADSGNSQVLEISADQSTQTVVGSGFSDPLGVSTDAAGNLFVGDDNKSAVFLVNGNGTSALPFNVSAPAGLWVDAAENVFIADNSFKTVTENTLGAPNFGKVKDGDVSNLVFDLYFQFNASVTLSSVSVYAGGLTNFEYFDTQAGTCSETGGSYNSGDICYVEVFFAPVFPGSRPGAIQLLDAASDPAVNAFLQGTGVGPQVALVPENPTPLIAGAFVPTSIAVLFPEFIVGADSVNDILFVGVPEGGVLGALPVPGSATGVALDGAGDIYVADNTDGLVGEFSLNGSGGGSTVPFKVKGFSPYGLAVDAAGTVYATDNVNNTVYTSSIVYGTGQLNFTGLSGPTGIALDSVGDVYVADTGNNQIVMRTPAGAQSTVGTGFSHPLSVAVDPAGNVYVADTGNNRIVKVEPSGSQAQIGPTFPSPLSIALDPQGRIYIGYVDATGGNIVGFDVTGLESTSAALAFPTTRVGFTSTSLTAQASNIGNAELDFSGLTVDPGFIQGTSSNDCSASSTLAPGTDCNLAIAFQPTATGNITGSVTLTDNSLYGALLGSASIHSASVKRQAPHKKASTNTCACPVTAQQAVALSGTATDGAATTTTVTPSANPSSIGSSVTFTATVAASIAPVIGIRPNFAASPTGTVTFMDGSTTLGTGTLSSGTATYSTASLSGGAHTITAVYGGDSIFAGSTSSPLTETVNVPTNLTIVATPGDLSIAWGTSGTVTLTITGNGNSPVSVQCYATGVFCEVGTPQVGPTSTTVILTIVSANTLSANNSRHSGTELALVLGTGLPVAMLLIPGTRKRRGKRGLLLLGMLGALLLSLTFTGCGNNAFSSNTAPGQYPVVVSAQAGGLFGHANINVTVHKP